jgi:hypothetical protein
MTSKVNHTTIRNENLFCLNCGGEHALVYPMEISDMTKSMDAFNKLHSKCKPTWKEPTPNLETRISERASFWLKHGEQGMSSKAIFQRLGRHQFDKDYRNHPSDPDDFKRCYKLLEMIPEWKPLIGEMASVSKEWSNLSANWNKLTEMYEQNVKEDWKNYKEIGMYEFMQSLIS